MELSKTHRAAVNSQTRAKFAVLQGQLFLIQENLNFVFKAFQLIESGPLITQVNIPFLKSTTLYSQ